MLSQSETDVVGSLEHLNLFSDGIELKARSFPLVANNLTRNLLERLYVDVSRAQPYRNRAQGPTFTESAR